MARWVHLASEWLKPIYRQIKDQMMKGSYLQVDETPLRYLDPGNGQNRLGYLWVAYRPGEDVLFEWYPTREARCLEKLIPLDFNGTIQCDGYSAYDHFAKQRASAGRPVLLAGCWAHARRYFYEALDHAPKEAGWILIGAMTLSILTAKRNNARTIIFLRVKPSFFWRSTCATRASSLPI